MNTIFEQIITLSSGQSVTVYCKGVDEFKQLLGAIITENQNRANKGWTNMHLMKDGRIMQRTGRKGISYQDFRAAYF